MSASTLHTLSFAAAETGVKTAKIGLGRQVQICVKDKGTGAIYDIVTYLATEEEKATREQWKPEKNLTGEYTETSTGGFLEIGIDVTTGSDTGVEVEIREFKLH